MLALAREASLFCYLVLMASGDTVAFNFEQILGFVESMHVFVSLYHVASVSSIMNTWYLKFC